MILRASLHSIYTNATLNISDTYYFLSNNIDDMI